MYPWILLGLLIFWLASVSGAYYKGHTAAQEAARAQYATQLEQSIAEHNENAVIDAQAAREAGERSAKARTRTVTITNEVERVIHEKPAPAVCRLTADTFSLLTVAVQVANGTDTGSALKLLDSGNGAKPALKP